MVDPSVVGEVLKSLEGRKYEYVCLQTRNLLPAKLIIGEWWTIE